MKTFDFEITVDVWGKTYKAIATKIHVYKYPHIRVAIQEAKFQNRVYMFHEVNRSKGRFFYFPFIDLFERGAMQKAIANKLEEMPESLTVVEQWDDEPRSVIVN